MTNYSSGPKILVAEDHPVNQQVMKLMLTNLAVEFQIVNNGREAVTAIENDDGAVGLILMDIMMPELDGFQASLEIRRLEFRTWRHTPIIACTALEESKVLEEAIRCGMDGYICKPVSKTSLKKVIEHWTRAELIPEALSIQAAKQLDALEHRVAAETIDVDELKQLYGMEQLDDIVALFLTVTKTLMAQLDSAIQHQNLELVRTMALEIRGSSFAISAKEMSALCLVLENASERENWSDVVKIYASLGLAFARVRQLLQDKNEIMDYLRAS